MSLAKETPYFASPTDYEDDFHAWAFEQAELLRLKRFGELDLANLVEEVESMGSEQRHALESSYRLLIFHLLKWQFQVERRSRSWQLTILRERSNIARREKRNPSLAAKASEIVADIYGDARREASVETGFDRNTFPQVCPYSLAQLRDQDFLPE
ncbi:DUF29 domain-containing protein [Aureimonas sp. Leaf324]|jgi:hypothetical protein|uniref:DUF29 domain-containing protein n=1 Tax=Aureimonas sp. Leaf324 TaxID=1736336 RepID=UPI0006FA5F8C|nr:DUF29 domain-containing protein [Aureimonas sp. Leaf324]KQQ81232.1 hypothetical protein ASF65_09520 [Aureimonas sp. Leaf324]